MKLAILSRVGTNAATRRLADAAGRAGLRARCLDPFLFSLSLGHESLPLIYDGREIEPFAGMIPRVGAGTHASGVAVIRHLEGRGVVSLNGSEAIESCRDKFRGLQRLAREGLPAPPTVLTLRQEDVLPAVRDLGGAPVVCKVLEAGQGTGVFLAETEEQAAALVRDLHAEQRYVLLQRYYSECRGTDLRALVVGGEVVAAMRRTASDPTEFRSNVHLGGTASAVELSPELADLAVRATAAIGPDAAGVDILESNDGPLVLEVNASPGLEWIEKATGVDVAGRMVAHLQGLVADRHRL